MNNPWPAKRKSAKFITRLACALLATGLFSVGLLTSAATPASAAVGINQSVNFQGRLLNAAGAVVADGNYNMQFKLYQDGPGNVAGDTGGTRMWTESWVYGVNTPDNRVTVKNGYFSIPLGTICAFTATTCTASTGNAQTNTVVDFNQDTLWLSMNIENTAGATALCSGFASGSPASCTGGDGEMLPMRRLSSSVYAVNAGKLGGLTSAGFIQNQAASPQTANFNLLSGAATTVTAAQIQTVASATAPVLVLKGGATPGVGGDLLQLQSSAAAVLFRVDSAGVLGSPNVSTAATSSTGTTLQTGNSSTSGNTGILTLATGNATSGNSGNITIVTGTATGTAGSVIIKNGTDSNTALQVQYASSTPLLTADTNNGKIDIRGTVSTAPLGATLLTNGDFATNSCASWVCGTGWAAGTGAAVHTPGPSNTAALTQSITVASGTTYQIDFTQTGATTGTLTLAIGSQTQDYGWWEDPHKSIVANASGAQTFSITPTTDYNGTLDNITVKAITGTALAVQRTLNSDGTVGLEVRSGGSGLGNSFIGVNSGQYNTTGTYNTANGQSALLYNTTGTENTANGASALYSNTTGSYNTANGVEALQHNTTGYQNTANGDGALQYNTTGNWNTANGDSALQYNTTGNWNTAVGSSALWSNTTGGSNTANGVSALTFNTTGSFNTANGVQSLRYNQTGSNNTALGYQAGHGVSGNSFSNNSLFGYQSGLGLTTGSNNVLLGYNAGQNLTTGANNIVLGYNINAPAAASSNTLNIGNLVYGTAINGTGSTLSTGNIGIGTTAPTAKLQVAGDVSVGDLASNGAAGRLFSDGFESGNLNLWNGPLVTAAGGTLATDTGTVRSGKYSAKVAVGSGASAAYRATSISPVSSAYARAYVNFTSTSSDADIIGFDHDSIATGVGILYRKSATGQLCIWNDTLAHGDCWASNVTLGSWHKVEMYVANGTPGTLTAWLDGTQIGTISENVSNTINLIVLGEDSPGRNSTYYIDDVSVDTALTGDSASLNVADSLHVSGTSSFGGGALFQAASNSAAAFQIQNAAGTSNLFVADTTNSRIGINTATTTNAVVTVNGSLPDVANAAGILFNGTSTSAAHGGNGISSNITASPTSDSAGTFTGIIGSAESYTPNLGFNARLTGVYGYTTYGGTGTLYKDYGGVFSGEVDDTATVTNYNGVEIDHPYLYGSGAITNAVGMVMRAYGAGNQGTNNTYLLLGQDTATAGNWGVYEASTYANLFNGQVTISTTSTTALNVQNASSVSQLTVDTTVATPHIYVGPTAGDTVGTLLVLGNKTNAGDPTGASGAMYYNSNLNSFRCYSNGAWLSCLGGLRFANTNQASLPGGDTVANTTTSTNFAENYSMPANDCVQGRVYRLTATGTYSAINTQPAIDFNVKLGATVIATTNPGGGHTDTNSGTGTYTWQITTNITCTAAPGASALIEADGFFSASPAGAGWMFGPLANSAASVATNGALTLQLAAKWTGGSAPSASDTVTLRQFVVEAIGP
jgi:hypothetical protein